MKLEHQNRIVKIRAQVLADALEAVSDLMNEIRQSEYYSGPYMEVKGFRKLERLWHHLSVAVKEPEHEVPETEALAFRQRKAARHGRQIKAVRDQARCHLCGATGVDLVDHPTGYYAGAICPTCWQQSI